MAGKDGGYIDKETRKKYERKMEKILAFHKIIVYTKQCCDIDSVEA